MKKKNTARPGGKPQSWIITGLLAVVAVAYVWFVFLPCQRVINERRAQVQERRQQIMQAQSLSRTVEQARIRLTDTRQVSEKWRAESPRRADLITQFASLTQQAQQAGVSIERLDPLPTTELNLIAQQNVTLTFHAPFAAVFDLLKRLEALPGTLWIRSVRLTAGNESDATLRGELTLTIFVDRTD
jgi:Tfp pilus assembly protein PilO